MHEIKERILYFAISKIERQIETAKRGYQDSIDESKAHKGAMESRYDTFKEEAQYLAEAQNARVQELNRYLGLLKNVFSNLSPKTIVTSGAVVEIEDLDTCVHTKYFILPTAGGTRCNINDKQYIVLTHSAPLGRSLIGKTEGEEVEFTISNTTKYLLIVSII